MRLNLAVVIATIILGLTSVAQAASIGPADQYNPVINPADFSTEITNPYFSLPIGRKMVYEAQTPEGLERIEVTVPGWTREVMGVKTLVYWDRVYLNGKLKEDTRDYLAQAKNGDLWYFGENVDNYDKGALKDHHGTWVAGVDGAKPGIWILANPQVGDAFRDEYYKGKAEDMSKVVSVKEKVTVPAGTYTDCIKTFESTPLESKTENKYYCKDIGTTALEVDLPGPDVPVAEYSKLISTDMSGRIQKVPDEYAKDGIVSLSESATGSSTESSKSGTGANTLTWAIVAIVIVAAGFAVIRNFFSGRAR